MSALQKNVASQVLTFDLVNATTGAALTGATVITKTALDGTQSAGAGTVTELGTGQYKYVPTQGETNGASVGFSFTATNAVPVNLHCFTIGYAPTLANVPANATQFAGQTITAAAGVTIPTSIASPTNITAASGVALSSAGVAAIWAYVVEGTYTAVQFLRLIASSAVGVLSGASTTTVTILDVSQTKTRVTASVDANGNRTSVSYDGT